MFHHSPRGRQQLGVTEYLLIIALVALIVIGALMLLGPWSPTSSPRSATASRGRAPDHDRRDVRRPAIGGGAGAEWEPALHPSIRPSPLSPCLGRGAAYPMRSASPVR